MFRLFIFLLFFSIIVKGQNLNHQLDKALILYENFQRDKADSILTTIKGADKTIEQKIIYCFLRDHLHNSLSSNQLLEKLSPKQITSLPSSHRSMLLGTAALNYATRWEADKMYSTATKAMKYAQPLDKINSIYEFLPYCALSFSQFAVEKYGDAVQTVRNVYPKIIAKKYNCTHTKGLIYNALGLTSADFGQEKLSLYFQEENLKCLLQSQNKKYDALYTTYNNLGQTNIIYGDYQKAMAYQLKAKEVADQHFGGEYSYEWPWHMGWLNFKLGNYDLFEYYTQKSSDLIVEKVGKNHIDYILINRVFIEGYLKFGNYTKAKEKLQLIRNVLDNGFSTEKETEIFLEVQLGQIAILEKKYAQAIRHLKKAYLFVQNQPFFYEQKIEITYHLASAYYHLNQKKSAHTTINTCFKYLKKTELNSWATQQWQVKTQLLYLKINNNETSKEDYEKLLAQLNKTLLNQNLKLLVYSDYSSFLLKNKQPIEAKKIVEKGLNALQSPHNILGNVKQPISQISKKMIAVAQEVYLTLYLQKPNENNFNHLFRSIEYKKANALQNVFRQRKLKSMAYVPDSIFKRDQFLKNRILVLKNQMQTTFETNKNFLLKELTEINQEYTLFIEKHKNLYPKYFGIMFPDISDIKTVCNQLGRRQCLLSFTTIGDEDYMLYISHSHREIRKLPKLDYRLMIEKLNVAAKENNIELYKDLAYQLYRYIFAPIAPILKENIFYIPSKNLAYLNPEILIYNQSKNQFDQLNYLLKTYNFRRNYSINLMMQNKGSQHKSKSGMLVFAPIFDAKMKEDYLAGISNQKIDSQYLYLLRQPFSKEMLKQIPKRYKAKKYVGADAKEEIFKQNGNNYGILHLSTHTQLNSRSPMNSKIYFAKNSLDKKNDGDLFLYEIYSMPLENELTVLSTCDAAGSFSQNSANELISLAHSFSYAGCKNLIYTLWSVDEQQTQSILSDFYINSSGKSPFSKDLRKSKLQYLEKTKGSLASPYYWGGLVIQSSFEPHDNAFDSRFLWLLLPLVLGVVIWRKIQQR